MAMTLSLVPSTLPDPRAELDRDPIETASPDLAHPLEALVAAYRTHGYRAAAIDPFGDRTDPYEVSELDPRKYGLVLDDSIALSTEIGGGTQSFTLSELLAPLPARYCGSIAVECAPVR